MSGERGLNSVRDVMDPSVIALRSDWTVRKAIGLLREAPERSLYYLYVTDKDGKLTGVVSMRSLLLAQPNEKLESLMARDVTAVRQDMARESVTALAEEKKFVAFPVVDGAGQLVGAIRPAELLAIVRRDASAGWLRMFGAGGDERALSSVRFSMSKRLPWLQINLATAFLAAAVVGLFTTVIDKVTALAVLLPVIAGQGGNAGAQALAVAIRGLAVGEIRRGASWRVVAKEIALGLANGLAVAIVAAGGVLLWYGRGDLALVMGLAMVVNMVVAGAAGAGIPMIMKAFGRDPAQSSSIIMTTVTDVVGFLAFLGLAAVLLREMA